LANIQSQVKRNRQNEKRRIKNSHVRSSIRTANKKVIKALEAKEADTEEIKSLFNSFVKTIDTAAQKGIVKQNTAARKKSRLAKKVNKLIQPTPEQA